MSGLVETALAVLEGAAERTRVAADNIGNMTTPGYKSRVAFRDLAIRVDGAGTARTDVRPNLAQGPLQSTGNEFDLAIQGEGFFVVASNGGELYYTRQGQFERAGDGRLMTRAGHALQEAGGGDLIVGHDRVEITADGIVLDGGQPIGQVALAALREGEQLAPVSGSIFAAPENAMGEATTASIRQGMLEGANVSLGDEMLSLMTASRHAETGARLVQVYDELMGRAFTTLGQRG